MEERRAGPGTAVVARLQSEVEDAAQRDDVEPSWRKYWLTAVSVEFWQGEVERRHLRLRFDRTADSWTRTRLRP